MLFWMLRILVNVNKAKFSAGRAQERKTFMNGLQMNLEARKEMSQWNLNFCRRLSKIPERTYTELPE